MTVIPSLIGGTANCLFQIATAIGYSLKHDIYYDIPTKIENPHYVGQQVIYSPFIRYIDGDIKDLVGKVNVYYEKHFHYSEISKSDCDYLILHGYYQSYLYFQEYRNEILKILNVPYEYKEGYIALHIRRGDYLSLPNHHPTVTLEYINSAIEHFRKIGYRDFYVFTDDFDYCYDYIKYPDDCNFGFSQRTNEIEDLIVASSCEHSIGSNSAFSWWIYWLNQNKKKIGVFPKKDKWFGSSLPHNVDNLYMPNWTLI